MRSLKRAFTISVLCLCLSIIGKAQTERGTIRGTVQDPTGAIVAGAKITATNVATNARVEVVSTESGIYNIPGLPAGTYLVTAEMTGFKKLNRENVTVAVAAVVGIDLKLDLGEISDSVTVTSVASQLQTENTERNLSMTERSYIDLPLTAGGQRSPEAFYLLSPGVSGDTFNTRVNGSLALSREIQLDGMSLNDPEIGAHPNVILNAVSPDAVQ